MRVTRHLCPFVIFSFIPQENTSPDLTQAASRLLGTTATTGGTSWSVPDQANTQKHCSLCCAPLYLWGWEWSVSYSSKSVWSLENTVLAKAVSGWDGFPRSGAVLEEIVSVLCLMSGVMQLNPCPSLLNEKLIEEVIIKAFGLLHFIFKFIRQFASLPSWTQFIFKIPKVWGDFSTLTATCGFFWFFGNPESFQFWVGDYKTLETLASSHLSSRAENHSG